MCTVAIDARSRIGRLQGIDLLSRAANARCLYGDVVKPSECVAGGWHYGSFDD